MDIDPQTLIDSGIIGQLLKVWAAMSQMFQTWVLSPKAFLDLAARLTMIPSLVIMVFGLFAAAFGARSIPFRIIAVFPGLLLGWFLGGWIASATGLPAQLSAYGLAIILAVLGGYSATALFAIPFGLFISIIAYEVAGSSVETGEIVPAGHLGITLVAAILAIVIAMAADKITTGISAAAVGAIASVLGFIGLARSLNLRNQIIDSSSFVPAAIGLVFVASAVIHFHYLFTEDERQKAKADKAMAKADARADKERMKRFESYSQQSSKRR